MKMGGIYARASTDKQGETVDHQVQMIKEYVSRLDFEVLFDDSFIYEDDGESAYKTTLLQRPEMRRMIKDIDSGLIDVVFFKGISRFARDSGEAIQTAKRLKQKGVRVISLEENYDSFSHDPTFFQIYAVMAEAESKKTSIRISLGNKQKARNGQWASAVTPFGYKKVKDLDEPLRTELLSSGRHGMSLHPDPETSHYVPKVFDMYVNQGLGRKRITRWLNENGARTAYGNLFNDAAVKNMLKNEVYIGNIVYGKTRYEYIDSDDYSKKISKVVDIERENWAVKENAHPPLIESEVFMKAQRITKKKRERYGFGKRFNNAKHPLTGLLRCSKCGSPMVCQKRTWKKPSGDRVEYRYYICSRYHQKGREACSQKNLNADKLEDAVHRSIASQIRKIKDSEELLKGYSAHDPNDEISNKIRYIEKEIDGNKNKALLLIENKELYDDQTFRELNIEIKEETIKLRKEKEKLIEELKFNDEVITKEDLKKKLDEFLNLNLSDLKKSREVFHEWINEIKVIDNKRIEIDQKFKLL